MDRLATPRHQLRLATAGDHDRVDRAFGRFRLDERAGYAAFLRAQAHAFLPAEAAVRAAGPQAVLPDWAERERARQLTLDLDELGVTVDPPTGRLAVDSAAAMLGVVYVLEGSRLGGTVLVRSVPRDFPRRFLDAGNPKLWRDLIKVLDATLLSDDDRAVAVRSAQETFGLFERSAHRELERAELA